MLRARLIRIAGVVAIVVGLALVGWGVAVWQWGDPVTGVYTSWQQRKLEDEYERLVARFRGSRPRPRPGSKPRPVDFGPTARRFRLGVAAGQAIGRIRVPRLDLDMVLVNGTDPSSLRKGPGRDPRTYMPGEGELVYVAGHRTTFGAPFAHIDRLRRGDAVVLEVPYGRFVYRITRSVIVPADDLARLRSQGREVVALQACHPRFSARERYIVYALPTNGASGDSRA
jgi:sortase A